MSDSHRHKRTGGGPWAFLAGALPLLVVMSGCDILDVDVPGVVLATDLDNPGLAQLLVDGVVGDFECAWNEFSGASSHHSDEYIPASGNKHFRDWGARKIRADDPEYAQAPCGAAWGVYASLQTARFQAQDVFDKLEGFDLADVPDKVDMQGIVTAYGAYTLVGLGEVFCSMALAGGPEITPIDVLQLAETEFGEAIDLATQTGNTSILNMAQLGRARVRLDLEDFEGAITDASAVPVGFLVEITRGVEDFRRFNTLVGVLNGSGPAFFPQASIPGNYHDLTVDAQGLHTQSSGTIDPRLIINTIGQLAFDFTTEHFFHDKWSARDDPLPVGSYKEAQLIIAEAAARDGDLGTARTIINDRHTLAGLPLFDVAATATQDEMITHVLDERRRELAFEAGHRLNDMLRFRGTPFEIPFLGEPGSFHPNGFDQNGDTYGTTTCLPLPVVETRP